MSLSEMILCHLSNSYRRILSANLKFSMATKCCGHVSDVPLNWGCILESYLQSINYKFKIQLMTEGLTTKLQAQQVDKVWLEKL